MSITRQIALTIRAFREQMPKGRKAFRYWIIAWAIVLIPLEILIWLFVVALVKPF